MIYDIIQETLNYYNIFTYMKDTRLNVNTERKQYNNELMNKLHNNYCIKS
jgi:hypothetical protein